MFNERDRHLKELELKFTEFLDFRVKKEKFLKFPYENFNFLELILEYLFKETHTLKPENVYLREKPMREILSCGFPYYTFKKGSFEIRLTCYDVTAIFSSGPVRSFVKYNICYRSCRINNNVTTNWNLVKQNFSWEKE